jgi:4-hydroxybenzoate polyprenyltransferase
MRWLDWIFAARPLLQLPIWSVYLVSLHYHHQLSGESFRPIDFVIMACISLIFTGAVYLNQVYDYESDRLNTKVGFLQRGLLERSRMLTAFVICAVPPLAAGALISVFTLFVFGQLLLLSYAYSTPFWRLKDRPIGGLFANAYGHGLLVSMMVMPDITLHNAGLLGWDNPIYFFLTVGGTYILTTIPDRLGDAATGKRSLAVVLGRNGAVVVALLFTVLSVLVAYRSGHALLVYLALMALVLTLGAFITRSDRPVLLAAKLPLLLLTVAAGIFYPGYLAFVVALLICCRIYYRKRFDLVYPELA